MRRDEVQEDGRRVERFTRGRAAAPLVGRLLLGGLFAAARPARVCRDSRFGRGDLLGRLLAPSGPGPGGRFGVIRGRLLLGGLLATGPPRRGAVGRVSSTLGIFRLGVTVRATAHRSLHGNTRHEHPADAGHGLAAPQPVVVEQPRVRGVELLEGVVGQHGCAGAVRDLQHEGITASDRAGRWCEELAGQDRFFELGALGVVDAVRERRVDDDDDVVVLVIPREFDDRVAELRERRRGASFGSDVGAVDDEVCIGHLDVLVKQQSKRKRRKCRAQLARRARATRIVATSARSRTMRRGPVARREGAARVASSCGVATNVASRSSHATRRRSFVTRPPTMRG